MHPDATLAAAIERDVRADTTEDPCHRSGSRGRFTEVESERLAVDIVAQIDVDHCLLRIDLHGHIDREVVHTGHGVMVAVDRHPSAGKALDRFDHDLFAVVEPLLDEVIESFPADFPTELQDLPLTDARRADQG